MKQVVNCGSCSRVIRRAGSFTAMLNRRVKVGDVELADFEQVKISLCRECADLAGYKVK